MSSETDNDENVLKHTELKSASSSLSNKILKVVFSLYLIIAFILTGIHMITEYHNTKEQVVQSLINIEEVVYKSLSITLWNYNIETVGSILDGLSKNDFLEGALITMPTGEQIGFGNIMKEDGNIYEVSNIGILTVKPNAYIDSKFFGHNFPIYFLRDNGKNEFVGHMYVYSSHGRVLSLVQSIFTLIVVAAIIKTLALWLIFVWVIRAHLSVPLKSFTQFMEKLNIESSIYTPVNIHSSDRNELKLLEETFNNMLLKIMSYQSSLEEKEDRLKDMNNNLSNLVESRTQELDVANKDLLIQNHSLQKTLVELEITQKELALTAHKAGMAEISSGVLHNIGNALNSVNIHNASVLEIIKNSKLDTLMKVNKEFGLDYSDFRDNISNKGKEDELIKMYHAIGPRLNDEKNKIIELMLESNEKNKIMMSTLRAQRKYVEHNRLYEMVNINNLLLDTITMAIPIGDDIEISLVGDDKIEVNTEKNKLFNIITNIILNARESVINIASPKIIIDFNVEVDDLVISIIDNGIGIPESDMTKIFNFGYTTRENHDGFGLHNSANQAKEIGGEIKVKTDSESRETVFSFIMPLSIDTR